MLIELDKNRHTHTSHDVCDYHKENPGDSSWAGCTCVSSISVCTSTACGKNNKTKGN